ncbi:MAG: extracellular solute-binding protein [Bradyrhizobiaceae bacterium]|nr:extracellular solute-binding protein [Bradyrhizobiaceae bacterium]
MRMRILVCASVAACLAGLTAPVNAAETWDETLKNTLTTWWDAAKTQARVATLNPVTINMCWASDKNALVADPAVVAGFQKIRGNERVTVNFPRDSSGTLLGSGDIMTGWEGGKLDCSTVSPDASILGLRSAKWNAAEQTMYASSMVIGVVNPQAAEVLGKFYNKDPKSLTFNDLVSVAGKNWSELAPGNADVANWGTVKGHATDCARSASCQVVAVALAYSASGPGNKTGRELSDPKVKAVIDTYREKIDHSEASTGRLTEKCFLNPVDCDFFFTYESRIPDIRKQIPDAVIVYNDQVIPADQVVLVTTRDPSQKEAAIRFIEHIMSPPVQKLIAEKYGFRPGTVVDVQGPVQKLKLLRLGIVRNPNPILVKAVLASVTTTASR